MSWTIIIDAKITKILAERHFGLSVLCTNRYSAIVNFNFSIKAIIYNACNNSLPLSPSFLLSVARIDGASCCCSVKSLVLWRFYKHKVRELIIWCVTCWRIRVPCVCIYIYMYVNARIYTRRAVNVSLMKCKPISLTAFAPTKYLY